MPPRPGRDGHMKFCPLKTPAAEPAALAAEYRAGRKTDVLRLGERRLFVRKQLKIYYISYEEIDRFFRRVLMVPVRVSCCGGEMAVEHLVICSGGEELAVILLRDPRMAKPLMEALKEKAPHAEASRPLDGNGGNHG